LATPCKTETEDTCEYRELLDVRDGQTYKAVKIGDQWWIAQNLNYEMGGSWCGGGRGDLINGGDCSKYGRIYSWVAAVAACPEGWHLPDTTEWKKLFGAVGGIDIAAKILKSQTGWSNGDGTDAYGFSALPAGCMWGHDGRYRHEGVAAYFWSAIEGDSDDVRSILIDKSFDEGYLQNADMDSFLSVRCIKD